jgi:hypothetical protein
MTDEGHEYIGAMLAEDSMMRRFGIQQEIHAAMLLLAITHTDPAATWPGPRVVITWLGCCSAPGWAGQGASFPGRLPAETCGCAPGSPAWTANRWCNSAHFNSGRRRMPEVVQGPVRPRARR